MTVQAPATQPASEDIQSIPEDKFWDCVQQARDFDDLLARLKWEGNSHDTAEIRKV